ncbi:MAG: hypothetical protein KJO41_07580 [Bacteroidia bacterium]|nr:hypothetical protein [Bacteroidia bacterium]NND25913.1 hypothetical protein [Flavobacteriaceae bacterium]MBT8278847.1 hypothetical protein [Bacteroidia bacterium]NNK60752.1 hypothetical protein [Flavobacteriaceae bacterium]NNL33557.1 hypothetical protein [Flavobacteriaceae bacterium]
MIVTPLDSAILDSKEQYIFYHKMVDFALKELIVSTQRQHLCNAQEVIFFKQYCDLLLYSIEAMRVKYMYDEEDNMKIDLTDSGFPNYLEFRYLFNDLELRDQYIQKLPDVDHLKEQFLDVLLRQKKHIKRRDLFQAASIVYYTSVDKQFIFNRFVQGKVIQAPEGIDQEYMTSWSFYDVSHNRPFMCFMYFNYDGNNINKIKEKVYTALKQAADREMSLDAMAYALDRKVPELFPKVLKRIDLGPVHNVFAKDENEITHAILEGVAKKDIPLESYAVSMAIEEVRSKGEFSEGGFFSKQTLQKWSDVIKENYVFAPHRIIQMLYSKSPELMNNLAKPPIQVADLNIDIKE